MAVLLIAEDEKDMQNIIVDFMKQGGHSCILANDGVEALSILENNTVDKINRIVFQNGKCLYSIIS